MIDQDITAAWMSTEHGWAPVPGNATPDQVREIFADKAEAETEAG